MNMIEAIKGRNHVQISGNGTRGGMGEIRTTASGIITYSPDELYITVHAGTPIADLEAVLAERNQTLPFEPMDHRVILNRTGAPTIGGALGVNADGPRRLRAGAMRESVLGLRVINGRGQELRTGGVVMKNVTGLDLTKFFTGSRGRLGLATEVTLRLTPMAAHVVTLGFALPPHTVMAKLMPLLRRPLDIEAAHYRRGTLYLRLAGSYLAASEQAIAATLGAGQLLDNAIWDDLRDWKSLADAAEIWRLFLRPTQAADLMPKLDHPFEMAVGGAQLIIAAPRDEILPLCRNGIFAICEKGACLGERLPQRSAVELALRERLIAVFDPESKFAPMTGVRL